MILAVVLASACRAPQQPAADVPAEATAARPGESVRPGINDRFLAPDLDVDEMVDVFEGESREVALARDAIVEQLELSADMAVADVGAGTGLFLVPLARGVGPQGTVYAVDIAPRFVQHMQERVARERLPQVEPRLCDERSVRLPDASVDVALVCDTYHHFEYPEQTLASLHAALRPGGLLVVVDFERIPGVTRDWLLEHVRADKQTFRAEIEAAGFEFIEDAQVDGLSENYLLRFRRP